MRQVQHLQDFLGLRTPHGAPMNREILGKQIHGTILYRAITGHDTRAAVFLANQDIHFHKAALIHKLGHPLPGSQFPLGTLLGHALSIPLQDFLLLLQHLLQVLCVVHVRSPSMNPAVYATWHEDI